MLWAAVLGLLMLTPGNDGPPGLELIAVLAAAGGDKVFHTLVFAPLGWLLGRAAAAGGTGPQVPLGLGIGYGAFTEVVQAFVPGRAADGLDLLADGLGVVAGWALAALVTSREAARTELPDC